MNGSLIDQELEDLVQFWIEYDPNYATKEIVSKAREKNDWHTLTKIMRPRITFGTAGLRAEVGPGFARMNDLVVMQVSQGLASYVKDFTQKDSPLAVIGFDHRADSKRFGQIVADSFLKKGYTVYLFLDVIPTPLLAFSILYYKADIGVMITASHNPKQDNGYKVYWSNGAQIVSPHDKNILSLIQKNLIPWKDTITGTLLVPDSTNAYLEAIKSICSPISHPVVPCMAVYTPMHGVGLSLVERAINFCAFPPIFPVPSQKMPDPAFPTVLMPNPEEAGAFNEAIKYAQTIGSCVIFSNDPDADRFALAEKLPSGEWKIFTGDEIGILLASYLVEEGRFAQATKVALLNTIVSNPLLGQMVANWTSEFPNRIFEYTQSLTGFKNIVNAATLLINQGYSIALAYEEALGYMCGTRVMDKDGISALLVAYECLLRRYPVTYSQMLESIYVKHGYVSTFNNYYLAPDAPSQVPLAFLKLEKSIHSGMVIKGTTAKISQVENLISSRMFTIHVDDPVPVSICFRASGTEPKLKFYSQLGPVKFTSDTKEQLDAQLRTIVVRIIDQFLMPAEIGLVASSGLSSPQ